jgi:hypothetical protein
VKGSVQKRNFRGGKKVIMKLLYFGHVAGSTQRKKSEPGSPVD